MNEHNPYSPPQSDVTPPLLDTSSELLAEPRSLPASAAFQWLVQSWALIKPNWGLWALMMLVWFAIQVVLGIIPVLGDIATSLLNPVFTGGFLLGMRAVERGEALRFNYLFEGFRQKFVPLFSIGALSFGALLLFMILIGGLLVGMNLDTLENSDFDPTHVLNGFNIGVLAVSIIIGILVTMLFWFTTQLIALNDVPVFESLKRSFQGCLRNPLALLAYVVMLVVIFLLLTLFPALLFFAQMTQEGNMLLLALAALVLLVEILLFAPWMLGTMYVSYQTMFLK